MDEVIKLLLTSISFDVPRTPKTKKMQVNYDKSIGGDLTTEVREMLKLGTQQRRLLVQGLSYAGSVPNPSNVIESVNAYLPSVWKIQKSLEYSKDTKIRIMMPLHFEWTSVLSNPLRDEVELSQAHGVFVYEVGFILVVRGLSHFNLANQIIGRVLTAASSENVPVDVNATSSNLKEAIKEIRTGAGVLDFCADEVILHWKKPPQDALPENRPKVLKAIAVFFHCQAQRLFLAKAMLSLPTEEKTSPTLELIPKLLLGLADKYELCGRLINGIESDELNINKKLSGGLELLHPKIIEECHFMKDLCEALAFSYIAKYFAYSVNADPSAENPFGLSQSENVNTIEVNFGKAVAFSTHAVNSLAKAQSTLSRTNYAKKEYGNMLKTLTASIREQYDKYQMENNTVYYARVDFEDAELPSRSQHRFVISSIKFTIPEVKPLSFEQITKVPEGLDIDQNTFNALPKEIQQEILIDFREKLRLAEEKERERIKQEKKDKKKEKGLFGFGKKKANDNQVKLVAPPTVDKDVFEALPYEMQVEIVNNYKA